MLKHIVLLEPADAAGLARIKEAVAILEDLAGRVEGFLDLVHGENLDFEDKSGRYAYGFVTTFRDRQAHLAYERHPDHQRAGAIMVASSAGGHDGIFVADLSIG